MSEQQEVRRGPGRPPRAVVAEGRRERRRTGGSPETLGLKLPIPDWVYDKYPKTEFVHRWFRAEKGRMYAKTQADDWDAVEGVDAVPGAADHHGNPVDHVLCVKYRDWWESDRGVREERRRETDEQIRTGRVEGKGDDAHGDSHNPDTDYNQEVTRTNRLS